MTRTFLAVAVTAALISGCSTENGEAPDLTNALAPEESAGEKTNPDRNVYFGDLHIHTRNSFDAYIFNVRATPDDAYEFGMGGTIKHPLGYDLKLESPPLDFMAVTDHAAYLGHLEAMNTPDTALSKLDMARDMFSTDPDKIIKAFQVIGEAVRDGTKMKGVYDPEIISNVWKQTVNSAEKYNRPGRFTTFAAYEYTATRVTRDKESGFAGGNLHRNVIFRGTAPDMPFAAIDSPNPDDQR
jgi:hypothetical protein